MFGLYICLYFDCTYVYDQTDVCINLEGSLNDIFSFHVKVINELFFDMSKFRQILRCYQKENEDNGR